MNTPAMLTKCALFSMLAGLSLNADPVLSESFDKMPSSEKWKSDKSVSAVGGSLVLTATGATESYANTAFASKAGDDRLNFLAKPVEIVFTDLFVEGTADLGNSVMVLIYSADTPGEGNSSSYLKIRLGDDGQLMLMCGATGMKEALIQRLSSQLTYPVKTLKLRFTATDFTISGVDAVKPFTSKGTWASPFDPSAWTGMSPYLMLRSVRRPGEGEAVVKVGALSVSTIP